MHLCHIWHFFIYWDHKPYFSSSAITCSDTLPSNIWHQIRYIFCHTMILIHSENLIRSYVKLLGMIQNGKLPPHGQHFVPGVNAQEVGVPCFFPLLECTRFCCVVEWSRFCHVNLSYEVLLYINPLYCISDGTINKQT